MALGINLYNIAKPENFKPLDEGDIYAACKAFVLNCALPAIHADNIYQGRQNTGSLPAGSNDYAVISILFDTQHGTAVEEFEADSPDKTEPGILTVKGLVEVQVQIDFCSGDDTARQRARRLATAARSSVGIRMFNDYGFSALYADDVKDLSFVGDSGQFVRRYMTTLRITTWAGITAEFPYFDEVEISKIEDVSARHKP